MWKEVSRTKAKWLFMNGRPVYALSSKLRPDNAWQSPVLIDSDWYNDFDSFCNAYKYYNANKETGRGIKFYVKEAA